MDRASAIIQALSKGGCCSCPARSPVTTPLVDPLHMKLVQQALTDVADAQKFLNSALMRQHEAVSRSTWRIRGIKELFELSRSTNSIPFRKPQTCAPKHFTVPSLAFVAMPSTDANQTHFLSARSKLTKQDPDRESDYDSDVQIVESPHLSRIATQKKHRLSTSSEGSVELVENQSIIDGGATSFSASSGSLEESLSSGSDDLPSHVITHQPHRQVVSGSHTQERKIVLHLRSVHLKFIDIFTNGTFSNIKGVRRL